MAGQGWDGRARSTFADATHQQDCPLITAKQEASSARHEPQACHKEEPASASQAVVQLIPQQTCSPVIATSQVSSVHQEAQACSKEAQVLAHGAATHPWLFLSHPTDTVIADDEWDVWNIPDTGCLRDFAALATADAQMPAFNQDGILKKPHPGSS